MAGSVQGVRGGIAGLCWLLERHAEAIEFDLLALGLRLDDLGTDRLTWRDLLVVIHRSGPESALQVELNDGQPHWKVTDYLLAHIADLLAVANWQRQGKKSAPKPKPLKRPGQKTDGQKYGSDPIPVKDFDDWWNSQERAVSRGGSGRTGDGLSVPGPFDARFPGADHAAAHAGGRVSG